jgi:glutamate--cysteine ligase
VWLAIERGRSAPVGTSGGAGAAWADYALRAPVMCIRVSDDDYFPLREPLTFAEWIVDGHELGWPTDDDLAYHLTTLFPPIRPRGWLELRMIDSLPSEWSTVPAIVTGALLEDADAPARISRALAPLAGRWDDAARDGVHDPDFARAATVCFDTARDALERLAAPSDDLDLVERFRARYVDRGRCPADDLLDAWRATGRLLPEPEASVAPVA